MNPTRSIAPRLHPFLFLILGSAFTLSGCLSSSYTISDQELERLTQLPPESRVDNVRVVQRWAFEDDPVAVDRRSCDERGADPATCRRNYQSSSGNVHVNVFHVSNHCIGNCGHISTVRHVHGGRPSGIGNRPVHAAAPGTGPMDGPVHAAAPPGVEPAPLPDGPTEVNGGGGSAGTPSTSSSGGSSLDIDGSKEMAVVLVALAAVVTVVLIATEGSRYDGYVDVDIDQPVHFLTWDDRVETLRLSDLTPADIGRGEAVILANEGVILDHRAPLDRQGFAWRMEGGAVQTSTPDGESPFAPGATVSFGYFPARWIGLLASTSVSWGDQAGGEFFSFLYGLELNVLPLVLSPLHLGAYASAGMGYQAAEGGTLETREIHSPAFQVGLMAELDIFTRLGLSARAGALFQQDDDGETLPAAGLVTVGFSIY